MPKVEKQEHVREGQLGNSGKYWWWRTRCNLCGRSVRYVGSESGGGAERCDVHARLTHEQAIEIASLDRTDEHWRPTDA